MMNRLLPIVCLGGIFTSGYSQAHPNVLIIYVDDMGIGDLSCFGGKIANTPNIDKLAAEGKMFTRYYSAAPVSSPSRVGLTSGMYPIRFGINTFLSSKLDNQRCEQNNYLDPKTPSMARAFQSAGYATAHIGKWHMGGGRDVTDAPSIREYGFDEYVSTYESPDPDPAITATNWIWSDRDSVKRWNRTAYFIDRALDFIQRQEGKPFFLNLWPDDVHTPWVPESLAGQKDAYESREAFVPVLVEMDKQLGRLMDRLEKLGVAGNTIVIFTSDNGPAPSFEQARTLGLRGAKNSLYEGGIRMPMIIRYPGKITKGTTDPTTVLSALDLYPSLCRIANIPLERGYQPDGQDLSAAILGNSHARTTDLMWDFGRNRYYNAPKNIYHKSPHLAIMRGNWKLLTNDDGSVTELYNLETDFMETTDVADTHAGLVRELGAKVREWYHQYKAPL